MPKTLFGSACHNPNGAGSASSLLPLFLRLPGRTMTVDHSPPTSVKKVFLEGKEEKEGKKAGNKRRKKRKESTQVRKIHTYLHRYVPLVFKLVSLDFRTPRAVSSLLFLPLHTRYTYLPTYIILRTEVRRCCSSRHSRPAVFPKTMKRRRSKDRELRSPVPSQIQATANELEIGTKSSKLLGCMYVHR